MRIDEQEEFRHSPSEDYVVECGEGRVGRRNALGGERVWRRAGKHLASE